MILLGYGYVKMKDEGICRNCGPGDGIVTRGNGHEKNKFLMRGY